VGLDDRRSRDLHCEHLVPSLRKFHHAHLVTILFSGLLALLIFLIAVMDNPYRGKIGVSPEPLERVYEQIMSPRN
jgi:hypothetical protein